MHRSKEEELFITKNNTLILLSEISLVSYKSLLHFIPNITRVKNFEIVISYFGQNLVSSESIQRHSVC